MPQLARRHRELPVTKALTSARRIRARSACTVIEEDHDQLHCGDCNTAEKIGQATPESVLSPQDARRRER